MNITFQTEHYGQTITVSHNNLPDEFTWIELMELYLKSLNSVGYSVDWDMINLLVDTAEDESNNRFYNLLNRD